MALVSVLIPMRNAQSFVAAALQSVIAQRNVELEVIVIDDGSTDRSAQIVQQINDPRVRIVKGPQRGIAAAFNTGLSVARGGIVARCDADDLYPPDRLAWQVRFLEEHPDFGAVCGSFSTVTESGAAVADHHDEKKAEEITAEL